MENEHKDYFGQPLEVGDYVMSGLISDDRPSIAIYKILDFEYVDLGSFNTDYQLHVIIHRLGTQKRSKATRHVKNVMKIDPALATFKELSK